MRAGFSSWATTTTVPPRPGPCRPGEGNVDRGEELHFVAARSRAAPLLRGVRLPVLLTPPRRRVRKFRMTAERFQRQPIS